MRSKRTPIRKRSGSHHAMRPSSSSGIEIPGRANSLVTGLPIGGKSPRSSSPMPPADRSQPVPRRRSPSLVSSTHPEKGARGDLWFSAALTNILGIRGRRNLGKETIRAWVPGRRQAVNGIPEGIGCKNRAEPIRGVEPGGRPQPQSHPCLFGLGIGFLGIMLSG